jgi:crotonobetainyl-CoA:carnitine CoA-transferase CaiB-like acyl-CoA transferase
MLSQGALTGVKVLDLSRLLPGPYCSMILADHGARVIAVEDKKQYAADGLFLPTVQRNKEHMSLNLKSDEGKEIFFRLAKDADVLIEGFRPGVAKRLGVDYDSIRQVNADIIYCSISGYGQTGTYKDRVGHDINYLGYAGLLDLIGEPDRPPSIPGIQFADIAGGGMNGAIGILLALFAREKTGQGQHIDISMTDSMVALLPVVQFWKTLSGEVPQRGNNMLSHRFACYNTYETYDGRFIAVGALENRFWRALCAHLGMESYAELQYDEGRRLEITGAFRAIFLQKTLAEWEREFGNLDLCVSGIYTVDEVFESPLFRERNMVIEAAREDGKIETNLGVPVKLSDTPGAVRTPQVRFGQSTFKVLKELGYTDVQIRKWVEEDVI